MSHACKNLAWAGWLGASGILLGAFAAHALKNHLDAGALESFRTGVRYQVWHALGLLALSGLSLPDKAIALTRKLWVLGSFLFSGSIYLLSARHALGMEWLRFLGPVTPVGGLLLIAGWGNLIRVASRRHAVASTSS